MTRKSIVAVALAAAAFTATVAGPVNASVPNGQRGYEGQPGHQGGGGNGNGLAGYEGQPGNQGGH
jgi:hypothetical protein